MLQAKPRPIRPPLVGVEDLAELLERSVHALARARLGVDRLGGHSDVAAVDEVTLAHLRRGHADALGDEIHLGLVAEHHLHRPEAAKGAGRDGVGEHRGALHPCVQAAIGARRVDGAGEQHARAEQGIGPRVPEDLDVLGDDRSVVEHAGPVMHAERVALLAGQQ